MLLIHGKYLFSHKISLMDVCLLFPPYVMGRAKSSKRNGQVAHIHAIIEKKEESFRKLSSIYP
ncbi:hypothetical protein AN963_11250 [Brevibacillus choshinensis]|uniref:Uncharacterized protein n=1 Tax=Brevibacillus choshinensis TaxID=54911 RepID=A0ABR5N4S4_BRECH|nr:hypothetical protein AN963_11250 [Brevibacillus choshinensis]